MAMANRMPVVTTPFHFAIEVVQDSRGVIIPYEDFNSTFFVTALSALLEDAALREEMVCSLRNTQDIWPLQSCSTLNCASIGLSRNKVQKR